MRKFFKYLGAFIAIIVIIFIVFLAYATLNDYKPDPQIIVTENSHPDVLTIDSNGMEISFMSWNIGYCGINKEMDFFYSGGTQVYPEEQQVLKNMAGVKDFLRSHNEVNFALLQEVDINSTRSYHHNQMEDFSQVFGGYETDLGINYKVFYVPIPLQKPMGSVESGIVTYSFARAKSSTRYSFEGNFSWPKGLFMLDRCFLVNRYPTSRGRQLVVINTHNSAYDDGTLKARQMVQLKEFLVKEYEKGNYVIVGGDWNQCPPDFEPNFEKDLMDNDSRTDIKKDYMPGWTWAFDNSKPTNRRNKTAYKQGETPTTVIDFFLLSPNIEKIEVKNMDMRFDYSDHDPVLAKFLLKY